MPIEQAIFTSARTDRSRGYQLVAKSPGVTPEVARELTSWGPSHGSLLGVGGWATSVNFHPLSSDLWCVAHTRDAGEEYSGRGGPRVFTQSFIMAAADLARFGNNPFAVLRATRQAGHFAAESSVTKALAAVDLPGEAAAVDEGILAEFVERWGAERIAWLVESAISADVLLVAGAENREALLAGLLNCLPVECRPEWSFATGLVVSPRRPFRIHALDLSEVELRRLKRHSGVTVLDLAADPPEDFVPSGWAGYLYEALALDALPVVCAELERPRAGLRLSDLCWLADQLTQRMHCSAGEIPNPAGSVPGGPPQPRGAARPSAPVGQRFALAERPFPPASTPTAETVRAETAARPVPRRRWRRRPMRFWSSSSIWTIWCSTRSTAGGRRWPN